MCIFPATIISLILSLLQELNWLKLINNEQSMDKLTNKPNEVESADNIDP